MVEQRAGSPSKVKDQEFITSLKAQGFEETSSKSKLVYNFEKKEEEERSNYADNFFLKNDEASKVGRDTIGRRNEVVEDEEVERKRDQLSPMRDNMVGSSSSFRPNHFMRWIPVLGSVKDPLTFLGGWETKREKSIPSQDQHIPCKRSGKA